MTWSEHLQEIHVQVMGKIQLEILEQLMQERFGLNMFLNREVFFIKNNH